MNIDEIKTLCGWRVSRGYRGLTLRKDFGAWLVSYEGETGRTSKNFPFNIERDMHVLWQLDEACQFLKETLSTKHQFLRMFGPGTVSLNRSDFSDGNDCRGVALEKHRAGTIRVLVQLHNSDIRHKFVIPRKVRNEAINAWCLAFARQIRALSCQGSHVTITEAQVKLAWREFLAALMERQGLLCEDCFDI